MAASHFFKGAPGALRELLRAPGSEKNRSIFFLQGHYYVIRNKSTYSNMTSLSQVFSPFFYIFFPSLIHAVLKVTLYCTENNTFSFFETRETPIS